MNKENKPKLKRLILDVNEKFHLEVKARATRESMTMNRYIQRAIVEYMKKERS
jgi:hypothetical protein